MLPIATSLVARRPGPLIERTDVAQCRSHVHQRPRHDRVRRSSDVDAAPTGGIMILGMSVSAFTTFHTVLSLIGIAAGLVALYGLLVSRPAPLSTALFLGTTVLTSVTGYFFPRGQVLPSHIVGALSLVLLATAVAALYYYRLTGAWRWIYVTTAVAALYLNCFVAIAQAFLKLPAVNALAPTQTEPPFVITQVVVLVVFVGLGFLATRTFHPHDEVAVLKPV
jgi:hypothetical protein